MKLLEEFKAFAMKGNVMDLAVGVIIGGAFGKIVSSVVNDIIMPVIGVLVGGVHFSDLKITIKKAVGENPEVTLNYGNFLQVTFDFLIVAASIFLFVKALNAAKRKQKESEKQKAPEPSKEEVLLTEIRDLLKNR